MLSTNILETTTTLINNYRRLKAEIKKLESEANAIKKNLITNYMKDTDTLLNNDGHVIATYKKAIRVTFDTKTFAADHKSLYDDYCIMREVSTFLAK